MRRRKPDFKVIAVDFDGTLCDDKYPNIGKANRRLIKQLIELQRCGHRLILYTCRTSWLLNCALEWCDEHGLIFAAVNENLPDRILCYDGDTRKISADIYIDDRAVHPRDCHLCQSMDLSILSMRSGTTGQSK